MPTSENPVVKEKYINGGFGWYQKVFRSDFETIAVKRKKYELLRFWLLGSWIAKQEELKFVLINLVPSKREKDIEPQFRCHILEDKKRTFSRSTWEEIYSFVQERAITNNHKKEFIEYFKNKTIGYNHQRNLQRAFLL